MLVLVRSRTLKEVASLSKMSRQNKISAKLLRGVVESHQPGPGLTSSYLLLDKAGRPVGPVTFGGPPRDSQTPSWEPQFTVHRRQVGRKYPEHPASAEHGENNFPRNQNIPRPAGRVFFNFPSSSVLLAFCPAAPHRHTADVSERSTAASRTRGIPPPPRKPAYHQNMLTAVLFSICCFYFSNHHISG